MAMLGFEEYIKHLKVYHQKYRELYAIQLAAAVAVDAGEPATCPMSCRTWTPKRAPHPSPGRPPQEGAGPREQTALLVPSRMHAAGRVLWRSKVNRESPHLFCCGAPGLGNFKFEVACSESRKVKKSGVYL